MSNIQVAILTFIGIAVAAYLLGSLNFALIFTWRYTKKDIREHGSGNAGLTNVLRSAGEIPAVLTLVCDLLKATVSVFIGYFAVTFINNCIGITIDPIYGKYIAGLFCFIGHIFPIYYGFRGGKGVLSLAGIMLCCNYRVALLCLSIFMIVLIIGKMVSLASITAALCLPFSVAFLFQASYISGGTILIQQKTFEIIMMAFFSLVVVLKHIPNIIRIFKGEEHKFSFSKKNK